MDSRRPTLKVHVLFFAYAQELAGTHRAALELPAPATVEDADVALKERFPRLRNALKSYRLAVDQEFAEPHTALTDDCELAVLPPVSGG